MSVTRYLSFILIFSTLNSYPLVEGGYLELYVKMATGKPIRNLAVTCKEQCATSPSDYHGKVRLKLPPQIHSNDWVTLSIVKRARSVQWVLISPWDDRVNVPSFNNKDENVTSVVVVRKGDKTILRTGVALQSLAERCIGRVTPSDKRTITNEERQLVLKQQAEAVGLTQEEVDQAIREWAEKAADPYQQGLAALYKQKFSEAEGFFKESIEKRKADLADAYFFLGRTLYEQGKYDTAIEMFKETLSVKKDDVVVLNWLGNSLLQARSYSEAEIFLKHAVESSERAFGKEHLDTAQSLNNLGIFYYVQGQYGEAQPLFEQALRIHVNIFGKEHLTTAQSLNNLAELYRAQGRYNEAETLFKQALEIRERKLGKEHLDTAETLNNLGALYYSQIRYDEAEPLLKRALNIYAKMPNARPHATAQSLNNLAELYRAQGRYNEAETLFKQALEIRETLGKDAQETAQSLNELGALYYLERRYDEAESLLNRALGISIKNLGEERPDTSAQES